MVLGFIHIKYTIESDIEQLEMEIGRADWNISEKRTDGMINATNKRLAVQAISNMYNNNFEILMKVMTVEYD